MSSRIYLSPPDVGPLEEEYVLDALRSGWVAPLGPHVDAFEREIGEYTGASHAVALSSGTAGIHLGLLALGVLPGDEVVIPTMTFAATAFAVSYVGATPVFIDSEPVSYNLDPDLLESFLASRAADSRLPAAVIVVDVYGQAADYDRLLPICELYGVPILEDAAEALGATHRRRRAGTLGRVGVYSFNGNKIMTTSGGGMLVTEDAVIAGRVRHLASQARQPVPWYEHSDIGFNYRLSNVLAALGRAQLRRLDEMMQRRRHSRDRYTAALSEMGIEVLSDAAWGEGNSWLTVALPGLDVRAALAQALAQQDIETRPAWKPMHLQPVFEGSTRRLNGVAESLFAHGICLPSGSALSEADVDRVLCIISDVFAAQ